MKINNINEAYDYVRENGTCLEITKEGHEFLGYDNKMYPARASLIVENDGNYYVSGYESDEYVKETGKKVHKTIETWIWNEEESTYYLDSVKLKNTGEEITLYEIMKSVNP